MALLEQAAKTFMERFILEAVLRDVDGEEAGEIAALYTAQAYIALPLVEPEVKSWKLGFLGNREDALIMRAIAFIVTRARNTGDPLPHVEVLKATFDHYAEKTPKARRHIDDIPWAI